MSGTCTDDAWNNIKDVVATASQLGDVMENRVVTHVSGSYAAGGATGRIRDASSKKIYAMFPLGLVAGERITKLDAPLTISKNMVVDVFSVAVPT